MSFRRVSCLAALVAILALSVPIDADARAGMGSSFGSRGAYSFSAPPVTSTAPRTAAPLERYSSPGYSSPSYSAPYSSRGGFFSGGFGRGFIGGLLGAGVFGLLFGNGLFGGLGGGGSFIGLLLQLGLIFLVVRFVMSFFRNQNAPVFSGPGGFGGRPLQGAAPGGYGPARTTPITIQPDDFSLFQQRLAEVQGAYGAEDVARLRQIATPEMVAHFSNELAANAQRGVINRLSDVQLLQGDLAEAWREAGAEYATVAMRYALVDVTLDRATGRMVGGSPQPQEVTEVWTFVRPPGGSATSWKLSAIQQT
jgi:predicted lipid-binding transport protein (Tim44 family)